MVLTPDNTVTRKCHIWVLVVVVVVVVYLGFFGGGGCCLFVFCFQSFGLVSVISHHKASWWF